AGRSAQSSFEGGRSFETASSSDGDAPVGSSSAPRRRPSPRLEADHLERLVATLELEEMGSSPGRHRRGVRRIGRDQKLARFGDRTKPSGDIDDVPKCREIPVLCAADDADVGQTGMDPHSHRQTRLREAGYPSKQVAAGRNGSGRMLLPGDGGDEEGHDTVPKELVDDPVPVRDRHPGDIVEGLQLLAELRWGCAFREAGRSPDIREQDRYVNLGATRMPPEHAVAGAA